MNELTSESDQKTAVARWSAVPFGVDDFDFPQWKAAKPVQLRRYWSGAEAPVWRRAEVRIIWSPAGLHALFECEQHEPLVIDEDPQISRKTIGLWDRDVCEVFIAPNSTAPENYFEFEAAPTGEWLDVAIRFVGDERHSDWDFQSGLTVAAKQEESRSIIAMLIPWSNRLRKPAAADSWRANFFRCVGTEENRGYLAWLPTFAPEPNFHVPAAFGWLKFE
jgi:Carbohydrate-binding family 9